MGLNPRYQLPEYAYLLGDAKPKLIFCKADYEERPYLAELQTIGDAVATFVALGEPNGRAIAFSSFVERSADCGDEQFNARRAAVDPEDIAVIVYTSGTTGKPKGAMLSHRAIMAACLCNLCWMRYRQNRQRRDLVRCQACCSKGDRCPPVMPDKMRWSAAQLIDPRNDVFGHPNRVIVAVGGLRCRFVAAYGRRNAAKACRSECVQERFEAAARIGKSVKAKN